MKTIYAVLLGCVLLAGRVTADPVNFDTADVGQPPTGWTATKTGSGKSRWTVEKDATAPSKPNVRMQSGEMVRVAPNLWGSGNSAVASRKASPAKNENDRRAPSGRTVSTAISSGFGSAFGSRAPS